MKKISAVLLAMVLVIAMAATAYAASSSADYNNGVITWSGSGFTGKVEVRLDGEFVCYRDADNVSGQKTKTLEPGQHYITLTDTAGNTATAPFTVAGAVETEEPTQEPTQ